MTVEQIRQTLYTWMKVLSFMMERNVAERSLKTMKAIHDIRMRLDVISHCSLNVHYRWLLKMHDQVIDILPKEGSRYQKKRKQILDLLAEAERKINADFRQRILVH